MKVITGDDVLATHSPSEVKECALLNLCESVENQQNYFYFGTIAYKNG